MTTPFISTATRQRVAETSRFRCGYCLTSQRVIGPFLEIDHIIPVSRGGTSDEANLILACPMCNSRKTNRVEAVGPETHRTVPLFHPRSEHWADHFEWGEEGAVIRGKTPEGRATVVALQMNHPDMIAVRRLWIIAGWHPPTD